MKGTVVHTELTLITSETNYALEIQNIQKTSRTSDSPCQLKVKKGLLYERQSVYTVSDGWPTAKTDAPYDPGIPGEAILIKRCLGKNSLML